MANRLGKSDIVLAAVYHTATGLMCGEYQHLCYLNMGRGTGCIEGHIGNVGAGERSDTFIYIVGTLVVAMEADVAEVGFHQSRFEVGHSHCRMCHVDSQSVGYGLHCRLGGAIHVSSGVCSIACHRTDVDDMTSVAFYHSRNNQSGHGEQSLDIGVDHRVPILVVAFVFWFKTKGESGIVYQHVDSAPFLGKRIDSFGGGIAVAHVEAQSQHFRRQFCLELGKLFGIASSDDEVISALGEFACTSFAYSACSTSNQCNLFHSCLYFFVVIIVLRKKCMTFSVQSYEINLKNK